MTFVFGDTFYFIALLNRHDAWHPAALHWASDRSIKVLTTAWVLTELADGMAKTRNREAFGQFLNEIQADPNAEVVLPEPAIWQRGIQLYRARGDKQWSLTDCISFVVMKDRNIHDALTADHHFEQAGFNALLK